MRMAACDVAIAEKDLNDFVYVQIGYNNRPVIMNLVSRF